ncbi:MAG TPA: hypothetical protein VGV69_00005 [Solirubrobacterales bacterium]|nr:hypothetical protein [Solirubrobacterales bacterium]
MGAKATISTLLVVLALGGTGAGRASAAEAPNFFTAADYPVSISGSSDEGEEWTLDGHPIACDDASFTGAADKDAITMRLTPAYGGCTAFGFPATVAMNGCDYLLELWPGSIHGGSVELSCPQGKEVTVETEFGLCSARILPHQKEASFEAADAHPRIGLNLSVSNITADLRDLGGFLCPLTGRKTVTDGFYIGSATLSGSSAIGVR